MKIKKIKKNIAKELLIGLLNSADDLAAWMVDAHTYRSAYLKGGREYVSKIKRMEAEREYNREISRLKQKKFLEEKKRGDRLYLRLTERGRSAALRHHIFKTNSQARDRYVIVIFDIPESERNTRSFFRRFLKEAGFIRLQQSVWVTNKDIEEYLVELVRIEDAEKWIRIITASKISNFSFKQKK
jgi:CRISPR-associated endonuclease Cas2